MPQAIPLVAAALPALGSFFGGQAQANAAQNAAQQSSDASRYGVDQSLVNSREQRTSTSQEDALTRALQEKLQGGQLDATASENALNRGSTAEQNALNRGEQTSLQQGQLGATAEQNALNRSLEQNLQGTSLGATAEQNALNRSQETALQQGQLSATASENALSRALQEKLANSQTGLQRDIFNTGQSNLTSAIEKGANQQAAGTQGVLDSTSAAPPELKAYQDAILKNALPEQERAQNEYASNLKKSGVTGSAGTTLLNRAVGDQQNQLSENANQMAYQDAVARRSARTNLYGSQASAGQSAALRS